MAGMAKLHIFRLGSRTPITADDLVRSDEAYNPKLHEAPIVVGHPEHNHPAFGWVQSLNFSAPDLNADVSQIDPAFSKEAKAGRYKKISASFYEPKSKHNPVPSTYYLRHVGFLGAQPPAVKGMRPVSFNEAETEDDFITITSSEDSLNMNQRPLSKIIAAFAGDMFPC